MKGMADSDLLVENQSLIIGQEAGCSGKDHFKYNNNTSVWQYHYHFSWNVLWFFEGLEEWLYLEIFTQNFEDGQVWFLVV